MVKRRIVLILLLGLLVSAGCDNSAKERNKSIAEVEEVKAELSRVKATLDGFRDEMSELKEKLAAISATQGKADSELTVFRQAYNDLLKRVNVLSDERDLEIARGEKIREDIERLAEQLRGQANEVTEYVGVAGELQAGSEDFNEGELDVIFVPTPQDVVDKMLELANVQKDDLVYDLGCGDGRIVVTAAKKYGCSAMGYDINPRRVKESLENIEKNNVKHLVRIERKDIFTLDLSKANVISLYLLPELNVRLIPQLEKLKDGSRIVSHDFDMVGVKPDKVVTLVSKEDKYEHNIYLWTTPLNKEDRQVDVE